MRKLLAVFVCIAMFMQMGISVYAGYEGVGGYETAYEPASGTANHIEVWANYAFVSTSTGLEIYDINTGELTANWRFGRDDVLNGGTSFKPNQTIVTDDYIIIVATFKNNYDIIKFGDSDERKLYNAF